MPGLRQPKHERELIVATASVTLTNFDAGKTVCNVGASGAVTVTLPDPATFPPGADVIVLSCADQNLIVSCASKLITFGNATASSVALQTSNEKLGGGFRLTAVGSKWHVAVMCEETQTITVA
jgi:hypothetical protein